MDQLKKSPRDLVQLKTHTKTHNHENHTILRKVLTMLYYPHNI